MFKTNKELWKVYSVIKMHFIWTCINIVISNLCVKKGTEELKGTIISSNNFKQ